jgi:hypothetical protein
VLSPCLTMRINRFGVEIVITPEQYDAHVPDSDLTLDSAAWRRTVNSGGRGRTRAHSATPAVPGRKRDYGRPGRFPLFARRNLAVSPASCHAASTQQNVSTAPGIAASTHSEATSSPSAEHHMFSG